MNSNIKKMKNQILVVFVIFALALAALSISDRRYLAKSKDLDRVSIEEHANKEALGKKFFIFIFNKRMSYLASGFFIQLVNF